MCCLSLIILHSFPFLPLLYPYLFFCTVFPLIYVLCSYYLAFFPFISLICADFSVPSSLHLCTRSFSCCHSRHLCTLPLSYYTVSVFIYELCAYHRGLGPSLYLRILPIASLYCPYQLVHSPSLLLRTIPPLSSSTLTFSKSALSTPSWERLGLHHRVRQNHRESTMLSFPSPTVHTAHYPYRLFIFFLFTGQSVLGLYYCATSLCPIHF
jgi:hypothetical protein